ncbi:helix-turn-helix transcriptional regulator [Streptomyces zaomyceticus]|uniref:helix-turn-helix domain-containing protein n=1 Tax=Streptomyces zaomyceticus TaxID=68286 RepID=UPI002E1109FA|nr:helix-turn-helix domain-containing protein [Streptomyces zaomyceticus]
MTTEEDPATPTRAQRFGRYVSDAARQAGYDIDSPRGGGKKALAAASGMAPASVSRMLAGQTIPDPMFFESLAQALHVHVGRMLVAAGVISEDSLQGMPDDGPASYVDTREMARQMGIKSPEIIEAFAAMADALVERERSHEARRSA